MADSDNKIGPFSSKEAIVLSGLSRTMLDYLVRSKLHVPTGEKHCGRRGARRCYSFGDIVTLRALASLLNAGVSVMNLKRALKKLSSAHKEIEPGKLPGKYLVTDGKDIYFRNKHNLL
ncbi:MAG: MerR family transcriptional regulator, partial [Marinoscillum sp.]